MRTLMRSIDRVWDKVEYVLTFIGGLCILACVLLISADVLLRNFVNRSIIGTTEIVSLLLMPVFMFGLAHVQRRKGHIVLEFATEKCSVVVKKILDLFGVLLGAFLCGAIVKRAFSMAIGSLQRGDVAAGAITLLIWPIRFALAVAIAILLIRLIIDAILLIFEIADTIKAKRTPPEADH